MSEPVLIGSSNKHKVKMLESILSGLGLSFVTLQEQFTEGAPDIDESGQTFTENAAIKAIELSMLYKGKVVSTDGGVSIPALGDQWNGLYTRRFAGVHASDQQRIEKLLDIAKNIPQEQRVIKWQEAVAVAEGGQLLGSTTCDGAEGTLLNKFDPQKYQEGIWVCSLWYVDMYQKHFFDLTPKELAESNTSWQGIEQYLRTLLTS